MKKSMSITDEEWNALCKSSFPVQDFLKALELWDSIRHVAGDSNFSTEVHEDMQKLRDLTEKVFINEERDCVGELFFESACLDDLMTDIEDWVSELHKALMLLNRIKPLSIGVTSKKDDG